MKSQVSVSTVENFQVLVRTGSHGWLADEPPAVGGDGLGPNPFDQLLGSLGSCIAVTVVNLAARAKVPLARLWIDLEGEPAEDAGSGRYRIVARIRVRGELSDRDVERLGRYAEQCPVHRILSAGAAVEMRVERV